MKPPHPDDRERSALDLLEQALELPERERAAFVDGACPDEDTRVRVRELLPLQSDLGPAPWADAFAAGLERDEVILEPGARVASYEIVRRVASGGMGRVYEAVQTDPRRRVALKVLRTGLESEEAERRFRYESDVLARLRHPGIAAVYASGIHHDDATGRDLPWIALELVAEARPIDAYAAEEGLDDRARLALFLQVLDAVQHGHQRGIIHRDLKPANLLVDPEGRTRVIDFGVALVSGDTEREASDLTVAGELIGTLRYMSPEQAAGSREDLDTCSDVYSLGTVLYELLCGASPHDLEGLSVPAAARVVAERDPIRPRRARPDLERDLEAILFTALERDKSRRYSSAAAFADDVRAWLERRPIRARPPGAGRQLALFVRRNPALVVLLSSTAAVLVVATLVSVRFGLRERAAREEAETLQGGLLDQSFALYLDFAPKLGAVGGSLELRRSMIEEAIDKLELLGKSAGHDRHVQERLGVAYRSLGNVLGHPLRSNLGDLRGAEECYRRSLAAFDAVDAQEPTTRLERLRTEVRLAELAIYGGAEGDGVTTLRTFVETARDPSWPAPIWNALQHDVANALTLIGTNHGVREEFDEAVEAYEQALEMRREILARDPGDPQRAIDFAAARSKVATARWSLGDPGAIDELHDVLDEVTALAARWPRHAVVRRIEVDTATLLGDVLIQEGDLEGAQAALDVGLRANDELSAADPHDATYRRQRGQVTYNQGWLLRDRGRRERDEGAETWRDTLRASVEWLAASREAWLEMGRRGELQPREAGNMARIEGEIATLEHELGSE